MVITNFKLCRLYFIDFDRVEKQFFYVHVYIYIIMFVYTKQRFFVMDGITGNNIRHERTRKMTIRQNEKHTVITFAGLTAQKYRVA